MTKDKDEEALDKILYPQPALNDSGYLKVSDNPPHALYWSEYGNRKGAPVLFVHGGPGGGTKPDNARFFDPDHYRIILFDQRGAGASEPFASLEANTTPHLIEDIVKLRDHLKIRGKAHMFGGSWGSTLTLAYGIKHPETVKSQALRGIFLCRKRDIDVFYQGDAADPGNPMLMGVQRYYPEAWKQYVELIPENERMDMVAAYRRRLTGDDEAVRLEAAKRWSIWEAATSYAIPRQSLTDEFNDPARALPFARIENHYLYNGAFMHPDNRRSQNYIIVNIARIADIPTEIVQGRLDMVCPRDQADDLYAAWQRARPHSEVWKPLHITEGAGHAAKEPATAAKLVEVTDRFRALDLPTAARGRRGPAP